MRFKIYEMHWWHLVPTVFLGSAISNNILHLDNYPWWVSSIFELIWLLVFWIGGIWLWNTLRPCYMTLDNTGLSLRKIHIQTAEIKSISISKRKRHSVSVALKRKKIPIQFTPDKTERYNLPIALEEWANEHGIPIKAMK